MSKEPTDAQKAAGNYLKGHKFVHGMRISVENEAGSTRRGKGKDGTPWESEMPYDYGYIRGTKGKDKDHLDAFLGPNHDKPDAKVHVVDQDDDEGNFDEHKVMLGFNDANDAYAAYHAAYPIGHNGFSGITEIGMPDFRRWAFAGKGAKTKRTSDMQMFKRGGTVKYFDDGGSAGDGGDGGSAGDGGAAGPGDGGPGVGGDAAGPGVGDGSAGVGGPSDGGGVGGVSGGDGSDGGVGDTSAGEGIGDADAAVAVADMSANPSVSSSNNSNGIAGMMGIDNPTIAGIVNGVIGMAANAAAPGIGGIAVGMANAAISGNPAAAASSIGNAVASSMGIPGIVGSVAGNAIGNMSGVPAASVPGDPTGGGSGAQNGALSQYYGQRQQQAIAPQSAPMTTNGYLPGNIPGAPSLYARGGAVGPLSMCNGGLYAGGGAVKAIAKDLGEWLAKSGVMDTKLGGIPATEANATALPGWLADFTKSRGIDPKEAEILASGAYKPVDPAGGHSVWAYGADDADHAWGYANGMFRNGSSPGQKWSPALRLYVADPKAAKEIVDPAMKLDAIDMPRLLQGKLPDVPRHILRGVQDVDGRAKVLNKVSDGEEFPLVEQTQHWIPNLLGAILQGGVKGVGFADGGNVSRVTPKDLDRARDLLTASQPFVGARPSMQRPEARNDREGAKDMPLQFLRGALAGTAGFGGDMEGIVRALLKGAGADSTPVLPTSDFYKDIMPLAPTSAAGRAASNAGSAVGVPVSSAAMPLARAVGRVGPVSKELDLMKMIQEAVGSIPGFAKGGAVGTETVGLGRFAEGDGGAMNQGLTAPTFKSPYGPGSSGLSQLPTMPMGFPMIGQVPIAWDGVNAGMYTSPDGSEIGGPSVGGAW